MPRKILSSAVLALVVLGVALFVLFRGPGGPLPGESTDPQSSKEVAAAKGAPSAGAKAAPAPGEKKGASEEEPGEAEPAPAEDPRPISLFGRVTDLEEGGVAGARILAVHAASWRKRMESLQAFGGNNQIPELIEHLTSLVEKEREGVPRELSGEDGSYAFRGLAPGEYRVLVTHSEFLPRLDACAAVEEEEEPARLDIRLTPGYAIAGTVIDAGGKALAGAVVIAEPARVGARGIARIIQKMGDASDGRALIDTGRAETGVDGGFRSTGLEPIPYDLTVRKEGYIEAHAWKVPVPSENVVLILETGSAIEGRVVAPDGSPVPAASLILTPERDATAAANPMAMFMGGDIDPFRKRDHSAESGDDGTFRITGLEPDAYVLAADAEGFAPLEKKVEVRGALVSLGDLVLSYGRTISGIVLAPDGAPVPGARVWIPALAKGVFAGMRGLGETQAALAETKTDDAGRFALDRLAEGRFEVRASADAYGEGAAADVEAGSRSVEVHLQATKRIAGIVLDAADGAPIAGARVTSFGTRVETDGEGRFVLALSSPSANPMLSQGRVFLVVSHAEYDARNEMVEIPEEGVPLEVRLPRARRIFGHVVDEEGRPVGGAKVRITTPGMPDVLLPFMEEGDRLQQVSSADGAFILRAPGGRSGPWQGGLTITATHLAYGVGREGPIPIPEEGAAWPEVTIILSQGSIIEGTVSDPAGAPVVGARIHAAPSVPPGADRELRMISGLLPTSGGKTVYSGADGRYRIEGLWEGGYDIQADARGFATKKIEAVQIGRGTHPLDISLDAGKRIEGRVVDSAGAPVAGAEVTAFLEVDGPGDPNRGPEMALRQMRRMGLGGTSSCRTDAEGRFAIADLGEGVFTVMARAKGYGIAERGPVRPGDAAIELVLVRYGAIRGIVTDATTGMPVPSFQIQVFPEQRAEDGEPFNFSMIPRRFDDPEGRFLLDDIRPGGYALGVTATGYAPFNGSVRVRSGEDASVRPSLEPGLRVEGIVLDATTGTPIEGVQLQPIPMQAEGGGPRMPFGGFGQREYRTDASGAFAFEGLAQGEYVCNVQHPLYYVDGSAPQFQVSDAETRRLEIRMKPAGRLTGTVRNVPEMERGREGMFLEIARLPDEDPGAEGNETQGSKEKAPPRPGFSRMANIDEDGAFSFDGIPPGRYRVSLRHMTFRQAPGGEGGASQPEPPIPVGEIDVNAGESAPVEFSAP
ncbi:MAG: carboxypeptidase regulatory-like domain-containing protein [Planctomycetes bacterium]|nr:carboxypeptidase regulatory-like domain-containing protein [Planctomycetota bacterium]